MTTEMYIKAGLTILAICYFLHKYGVFDYIKNKIMWLKKDEVYVSDK